MEIEIDFREKLPARTALLRGPEKQGVRANGPKYEVAMCHVVISAPFRGQQGRTRGLSLLRNTATSAGGGRFKGAFRRTSESRIFRLESS